MGVGLGVAIGDGVGVGGIVGVGVGVGIGVGVGVGEGDGDGDGVGKLPLRTTVVELPRTPSAVTITVDVPAPLNSAGTSTCISSIPDNPAGATLSTIVERPRIVTVTLFARLTPVAKIESRSGRFDGSKGPAIRVSEFKITASPRPSPATVNTPGAA